MDANKDERRGKKKENERRKRKEVNCKERIGYGSEVGIANGDVKSILQRGKQE